MRCGAVLTAAGSGTRLGDPRPKALVPLAGVSLVERAATALAGSGVVAGIVVTAPAGRVAEVAALFPQGTAAGVPVQVVAGGPTRQASVAAGLAALAAVVPDCGGVLVHDAARCLATPELVRRLVRALEDGRRAVVPALPVTDTIKQAVPGEDGERVGATPDRSLLRAVQTPQAFDRALLERAHRAAAERAGDESSAVSDDAGLVELLGEEVHLVAGEAAALKITTAEDLAYAEWLLTRS